MIKNTIYRLLVILLALFSLQGCAQLSVEEKEDARLALDKMAEKTVAELLKSNDDLEEKFKHSVGYMVTNWKTTKVPVVGGGSGDGVIVDQKTGHHTYVKVKRFDIGGGMGARSYKNLVLIKDAKFLKDLQEGKWNFEAGAEVAAGTAGTAGGSSGADSGYKVYMLLDGGGSATATVRAIRVNLDTSLN